MLLVNATRVLCLGAALVAAPLVLGARTKTDSTTTTNGKILSEISVVRDDEGRLDRTLDELQSISREPLLFSMESHMTALNAARDEINHAGKELSALTSSEQTMTEKERTAIESNKARLAQVAKDIEQIIVKVNDDHSYRLRLEYQEAVKAAATAARDAHSNARHMYTVAKHEMPRTHKAG